jgi:hypothetical protein
MANFDQQGTNFPVCRLSTHRLFSTPVVPDDDTGSAVQNVVTPVTQAAIDPLMWLTLQTLPLLITPTSIETPLVENIYSCKHVQFMFFFYRYKLDIESCWFFGCIGIGSIGS